MISSINVDKGDGIAITIESLNVRLMWEPYFASNLCAR